MITTKNVTLLLILCFKSRAAHMNSKMINAAKLLSTTLIFSTSLAFANDGNTFFLKIDNSIPVSGWLNADVYSGQLDGQGDEGAETSISGENILANSELSITGTTDATGYAHGRFFIKLAGSEICYGSYNQDGYYGITQESSTYQCLNDVESYPLTLLVTTK